MLYHRAGVITGISNIDSPDLFPHKPRPGQELSDKLTPEAIEMNRLVITVEQPAPCLNSSCWRLSTTVVSDSPQMKNKAEERKFQFQHIPPGRSTNSYWKVLGLYRQVQNSHLWTHRYLLLGTWHGAGASS